MGLAPARMTGDERGGRGGVPPEIQQSAGGIDCRFRLFWPLENPGGKAMSDQREFMGRRGFLNRVALAASAARLSPALIAAAGTGAVAAEAKAAEPAKPESGYTTKLAEYAARFRYEEAPPEVRQRIKDCIT